MKAQAQLSPEMPMGIRVGTAPVSWGILEVERWIRQEDYREVLDEIALAGYQGTELGPYGYFPTHPQQLKEELSVRGLTLVSAFTPIPLAQPERHEVACQEVLQVADLLSQCGASVIVLADAMSESRMAIAGRVREDRDGMTGAQWKAAAKFVMSTARACSDHGLQVAFHHHAGTLVETPGEVERLLESVDPDLVGLCFDTGHYAYGGGDPVDAVRRYGSRIRHLHLKDIRPAIMDLVRREGVSFLDAVRRGVFCELGEGTVDFPRVLERLSSLGYNGWVIVEQDVDMSQPGVKPLESAIRSREYLRKALGV